MNVELVQYFRFGNIRENLIFANSLSREFKVLANIDIINKNIIMSSFKSSRDIQKK